MIPNNIEVNKTIITSYNATDHKSTLYLLRDHAVRLYTYSKNVNTPILGKMVEITPGTKVFTYNGVNFRFLGTKTELMRADNDTVWIADDHLYIKYLNTVYAYNGSVFVRAVDMGVYTMLANYSNTYMSIGYDICAEVLLETVGNTVTVNNIVVENRDTPIGAIIAAAVDTLSNANNVVQVDIALSKYYDQSAILKLYAIVIDEQCMSIGGVLFCTALNKHTAQQLFNKGGELYKLDVIKEYSLDTMSKSVICV